MADVPHPSELARAAAENAERDRSIDELLSWIDVHCATWDEIRGQR